MRKFLLLFCLASFGAIFAHEKVYFSSDCVKLQQNQIFIQMENEWVPIQRISVDGRGYHVYSTDLPLGFWICRNGHPNYPWNLVCSTCGAHR